MKLISSQSDLTRNIERFAKYLEEAEGPDADFARGLLRKGVCFVAMSIGSKEVFAPSRFIGYENNSREVHLKNDQKDGRETTPVITRLLGSPPVAEGNLELRYTQFCNGLGIEPYATGAFGVKRKFWDA